MDVTEWGEEGYVTCWSCDFSYKCHLWAWGHRDTLGHCDNCGEPGRTMVWSPADEPWEPTNEVLKPEFGKPDVN